jgi:hypothetical protein
MNDTLTTSVLEKRMRPGGYSTGGFLGEHESLLMVISRDSHTLEILGITFEQIANALEDILRSAFEKREEIKKKNYQEYARRENSEPKWHIPRFPSVEGHETVPRFTINRLPSIQVGYLVRNNLQVFLNQYRGSQSCPWGCDPESWSQAMWGDFDFLIVNRRTGLYFTGPGMIVHLIREHHFFEGSKSPYRVSPTKAALTLGLLTKSNPDRIRHK